MRIICAHHAITVFSTLNLENYRDENFALTFQLGIFFSYLVVVVARMVSDGYNRFIASGRVYPIIGTIVAVDSGPAAGGGGSYDRAGTCLGSCDSTTTCSPRAAAAQSAFSRTPH